MLAYSGRGKFTVDKLDLNTGHRRDDRPAEGFTTPKNARVTYQLAPNLPLIDADPVQIRQVILNLLTNATEAIGDHRSGSVIIRTDNGPLDADTIGAMYPGQGLEPDDYVRSGGQRRWVWHEHGNHLQDFRPVLHDEICRARSGPGRVARDRAGPSRREFASSATRAKALFSPCCSPREGSARQRLLGELVSTDHPAG